MDIGPPDEEGIEGGGGNGGNGGGGEDYEIEEDLEYNNNNSNNDNHKDNSNEEIASLKTVPLIVSSRLSSVSSTSTMLRRGANEIRHRRNEENHRPVPRTRLTVQCKSKFEQDLEKQPADSPSVPYLATFIKWLATFLLGSLFLTSLVFSRLSMISLTQHFNSSLMLGGSDNIHVYGEQDYVVFSMLLLLLIIPHCITLLQSIWVGGLGSHTPWPDNIGLAIIVLTSLLESTGMCIFVFGSLGDEEALFSVIFMKMIFFITTAYNLYRCLSIGFSRVKKWSILFLITLFFELSGIALAFYSHANSYDRSWRQIVFPLLSLLSLSLAWLPPLQKRQVIPRSVPQRANYRAQKNLIYQNLDIETARWKAGAIAAFCKAVFTVCIAFAINHQLVSDETQPWKVLTKSIAWREHPVELKNFLTNLCASFIGILVAYVTCKISLDFGAFGIPLFLSGLLCILILAIPTVCDVFQTEQALFLVASCESKSSDINFTLIATICLILAEILASWYIILQADKNLLPKDSAIFLMPGYNGVMLEEWIVLNRHREPESSPIDFKERVKNSKIYICTTMYREADYEMKQLLESINRVKVAQFESIRHFESHIFFDGGVKGSKPTEFALQLLSLLPSTLDISPKNCKQLKTPYGICLKWNLPAPGGKNRMKFCIHLKDNLKTIITTICNTEILNIQLSTLLSKAKPNTEATRLYYFPIKLLYYHTSRKTRRCPVSENSEGFILTTDADVFFTPDSVEALLDLMTRDESVGAVCARTHPLGSGPLIWYQKFEYAIGHWFQKSAEDILGSVLCSPGCFSVYRCDAIMDVLPTYSTTVNEAFDFLIKDMGEDRWFCTLMLQNGWRIDYCAVATNSTHCPDGFDEFFKQRRRWIVSTIANLILVVKESRLMMKFNRHISVFFIIYQFVLLLATVIGPATVILVVSGGLQYGWSISPSYSIIIQYVCSAIFIIICLGASGDFQLKIIDHIYPDSGIPPVSISDIYLFALIAIFLLSSLCHLQEITNLLNGVWYLLCLPTGYLVLIMYSICNLTDKSWGTREDSSASTGKETAFLRSCFNTLKSIFPCCRTGENRSSSGSIIQPLHTPTMLKPGGEDLQSTSEIEVSINMDGDSKHDTVDGQLLSVEYGVKVIPVQEWLPDSFKDLYSQYFMRNGYDDTRLISGMHEKELVDIGIKSKGHRQYLMDMIKLLPDFEPDTEVPESALIWLQNIGLSMYKENFKRNCIIYRRDMAVLKTMSIFDIKRELKIIKKGHIKRLQLAIKKLLDPTDAERTKMQIKRDLSMTRMIDLEEENPVEDDFWKELVQECLDPSSAFSREDELKGKLGELRNNWTLVIAVSNTIWLVLLATMATQANLAVYSSNPLGNLTFDLYQSHKMWYSLPDEVLRSLETSQIIPITSGGREITLSCNLIAYVSPQGS
ncbi:uncharacterized protein LOC106878452 [Octopus bimaculoides]|nr:uncharacterized protein LOC106878452 [Octopus bimaculoides]|eukprot:XP_014783151.1 PREDICTED: uncharacterized protein LOC106878452 [Octopus bimaculoides]